MTKLVHLPLSGKLEKRQGKTMRRRGPMRVSRRGILRRPVNRKEKLGDERVKAQSGRQLGARLSPVQGEVMMIEGSGSGGVA
jgi:hypothetical protein